MPVVHADESDFETVVLRSGKPVICDFWATWCGPCQMLAPELEAIAAARSDLSVVKVDVDRAPGLAARFGIDAIPAVLLFRDGQVAAQTVGFRRKDELLRELGL